MECQYKLNVILEERVVEEGIQGTIHYEYNKNGWKVRRTEEIQGNGRVDRAVTSYGYDANGNLTSVKTPKGYEVYRKYDADDRITEERYLDKKNGIDSRICYTYDAAGNVLAQTVLGADGEQIKAVYCYDLNDRMTHRREPGGAVTRYVYDRNGRLTEEIGPYGYEPGTDRGRGTSYAYDSRGNVSRVTNALGQVAGEFSYNLQDLPTKQKDAFGNTTETVYGFDGQIVEVRRENGRDGKPQDSKYRTVQKYEYNVRGQIIGIIDGNHEKVSYGLDGWGRITAVGYSDGVKEGYQYTPAGQVSAATDGNGNAVRYRYNSLGKVRERIDQLGEKETYQYDEEGNLALYTDRDGRQVRRSYNIFGDPVYENAEGPEGEAPIISTWQYDSLGRLTRAVREGHSYEYEYDAQGRLKEKRSSGKRLVSYTYDSAGQVKEIRDPAGARTCYEYDILGRTIRIHNTDGLEVGYAYDSMDRLERVSYGNGVETAYAYDMDGNLSRMETRAGDLVLMSFAYQYDGNGNRIAKTGFQGYAAAGSCALDISYRYDIRGQLLEERRGGRLVSYAYDAAGNRVKKADGQGETLYYYSRRNQLIGEKSAAGRKRFVYDRQGGVTEEAGPSGIRRFVYDSLHRQVKVETEEGGVQESRYDTEGLRYELLENGKRTCFVYHNGELLYENGKGGETSYHLGAGTEAFRREQGIYYYHQDEQLSTALITDDDRDVRNQYQYDAFGLELESMEELQNRLRYSGQQYDYVTGQYYLRARYYNPDSGRFSQEDVYQGDGLNLYAYCKNNPVMYYDPSGYNNEELGGCPPGGLVGNDDIDEAYSEWLKIPKDENGNYKATVAVGRTNIKGLEGEIFKGASKEVVDLALAQGRKGIVDVDYINNRYPDRTIRAPYDPIMKKFYSLLSGHAEEMLMADFEQKVRNAGLNFDVSGDLYIIQSNKTGVCSICTLDLFKPSPKGNQGIFKQFMACFPNVNVYVSTYKGASCIIQV